MLLYRLWEAEVGGSGRRSAVDYADGLIEVLVLGCRLELWRSCTCLTTTGFEVADYCYECYCTTLTTFTFCSFSLLSGRGGLLEAVVGLKRTTFFGLRTVTLVLLVGLLVKGIVIFGVAPLDGGESRCVEAMSIDVVWPPSWL